MTRNYNLLNIRKVFKKHTDSSLAIGDISTQPQTVGLAAHDLTSTHLVQNQTNASEMNDKWNSPPRDWLELNVDAALFELQQRTSFGAILRDHEGHIVDLFAWSIAGLLTLDEAECMGIREALTWL